MSRGRRRQMIDREHPNLSVVRQCSLLGISRSSVYSHPREVDEYELELMSLLVPVGNRPPVPGNAILRFKTYERLVEDSAPSRQSQAGTKADEIDGDRGDLPAAQHQQAVTTTQGISIPAKKP